MLAYADTLPVAVPVPVPGQVPGAKPGTRESGPGTRDPTSP